MNLPRPSRSVKGLAVRPGGAARIARALPEETAVALVYNGTTQAVMMATPADLEDFGLGFTLTEGIVEDPGHIESLEVVAHDAGVEVRMWLPADRAEALARRRRAMAGPVGCGLCGIDSLGEALRPVAPVTSALTLTAAEVNAAVLALATAQPLHDRTHAAHAAAFWQPGAGLVLAREDVGRHNALDKLAGAMARADMAGASGALVITSRVSVDMVQKAAAIGAPVLIAVSAPTAHALRLADGAGITLVTGARGDGFDIFTHPHRIDDGAASHVA